MEHSAGKPRRRTDIRSRSANGVCVWRSLSILKTTAIAMRHRYSRLVTLAAVVSACQGEPGTTAPTPPAPSTPPAPPVLLRDVVIPNLPAPYYHFEYDTGGRVRAASFASGLRAEGAGRSGRVAAAPAVTSEGERVAAGDRGADGSLRRPAVLGYG